MPSKLSDEEWKKMRKLYEKGVTPTELGEQFSMHLVSVCNAAKRFGWINPRKVKTLAKREFRETVQKRTEALAGKVVQKWEKSREKLLQIMEQALEDASEAQSEKDLTPKNFQELERIMKMLKDLNGVAEDSGPKFAINIGLLSTPAPVQREDEYVEV